MSTVLSMSMVRFRRDDDVCRRRSPPPSARATRRVPAPPPEGTAACDIDAHRSSIAGFVSSFAHRHDSDDDDSNDGYGVFSSSERFFCWNLVFEAAL